MTTLRGHFDGKVIVPTEPVNLPENEELIIHVEPAQQTLPRGTSGQAMIDLARKLSFPKEDLEEMNRIIDEDCERIDPEFRA